MRTLLVYIMYEGKKNANEYSSRLSVCDTYTPLYDYLFIYYYSYLFIYLLHQSDVLLRCQKPVCLKTI